MKARNKREEAWKAESDARCLAEAEAIKSDSKMNERKHEIGSSCWCNPKLEYVDPKTKDEIWVHNVNLATDAKYLFINGECLIYKKISVNEKNIATLKLYRNIEDWVFDESFDEIEFEGGDRF